MWSAWQRSRPLAKKLALLMPPARYLTSDGDGMIGGVLMAAGVDKLLQWVSSAGLVLISLVVLPASAAPPVASSVRLPAQSQQDRCAAAAGFLSDSHDYAKAACRMRDGCEHLTVEAYYAATEAAWNAIWSAPESPGVIDEATIRYDEALAGLLETGREQGRLRPDGLWVGSRYSPIRVPVMIRGLPVAGCEIESIEPHQPPEDRRINRRFCRGGFGWPVTVRLKPGQPGTLEGDFDPPRQSLAATAVLRFRQPGGEKPLHKLAGTLYREPSPAVLDLVDPATAAGVRIGQARPPLAADFTAPLLDMLDGMPESGLTGFLQPFGGADTEPRLEFLQPHVKGRIPVIFIHGLASDEGTWFDMLNELRACPVFQRYYEPWVYHYPTGASFLPSSAVLRQSLTRMVKELDPDGTDPCLQNLVLIGHSMGGLHAKLQVVSSGNHFWNALATVPFDQIRMPSRVRQEIAPALFFKPAPFVKRVIFIATPHQGSSLASLGLAKMASLTVQRPPELTAIHHMLVSANPGAFRPEFEQNLPTTVELLKPNSPLLKVAYKLRPACWVSLHSVIGVVHHSVTGERTDCVVPESSARYPGVLSELDVRASHTKIHHHLETVAEIERILREHLRETGLGSVDPKASQLPMVTTAMQPRARQW